MVRSLFCKLFCDSKLISFCLVVSVISAMNSKYRTTLAESKRLNGIGLLQRANANHITADKILYDHAIHMVSLLIFSVSFVHSDSYSGLLM